MKRNRCDPGRGADPLLNALADAWEAIGELRRVDPRSPSGQAVSTLIGAMETAVEWVEDDPDVATPAALRRITDDDRYQSARARHLAVALMGGAGQAGDEDEE